LETTNENWEEALSRFQEQRKPNADAIADLALHNYIEMRDLSGRADFQLRLKIEKLIAEKFPEQFQTHYSMVTFSELSYAEAKRRGEEQNDLLDKIMALPGIENNWQSQQVLDMAATWLAAHQPQGNGH
ncbi:MAG TPA: hypothetical protein VG603_06110, partial [Chitinophagales bacterium]|nr:hypothetical protein [Chitinophagales bacterium]